MCAEPFFRNCLSHQRSQKADVRAAQGVRLSVSIDCFVSAERLLRQSQVVREKHGPGQNNRPAPVEAFEDLALKLQFPLLLIEAFNSAPKMKIAAESCKKRRVVSMPARPP